MGKLPETRVKKEASEENDTNAARDKFKGELSKLYESDSSDSDDGRARKTQHSPKKQKGDRPARRPKVRISHHVKEVPTPAFVMKLFDRSVDLTQFTPETPLYPICRAWFRNNPKDSPKKDHIKKKEDKSNSSKDVHRLPPPLPFEGEFVPPPMPPPTVSKDFTIDPDPLIPPPTKAELMDKHLKEWTKVKARIRQESWKREMRFKDSLKILRNLHFFRP